MKLFKGMNNFLLEEAGDKGGGGGAGDKITITEPPPAEPPKGDPPAGDPPKGAVDIKFPDNWKESIEPEFRDSDGIKRIQSVPELAKAFVNAQKLVGADKVAIPGKHATEDDWKQVFQKLGLPVDVKDYAVTKPKDAGFGDEFVEAFKVEAHKAGIMPAQSQKLMEWFATSAKAKTAEMQAIQSQSQDAELTNLKKEWGEAFDAKLSLAKIAVQKWADKETIDYLNKTGLASSPQLIRLLAKAGEVFKEDVVAGKGGGSSALTPKEAEAEVNKIYGDPKHPYWDKNHPNHKAAVNEVSKLQGWKNPS